MTDREKVISDVISAFDEWENNMCCPGDDWSDVHQSRDMVIALLKAREPKLVTNIHKEHNNVLNPNVPWIGKCPKCGKKIEGRNLTRFCKFCGQAVKWE